MKIDWTMTNHDKINWAYWCGAISQLCIMSLIHDYFGKEKIIEAYSKHWISASTSVPIAIIFLLVFGAVFFYLLISSREEK